MKRITISLLLVLSFLYVSGQDKVKFTYDQSGNRLERNVISMTKSAQANTKEVFDDKINEHSIKIYPNPTKGQLKVEIQKNNDIASCTITINAMGNGKLVLKKKAILPVTDIDIGNQPNGIYIMTINIDGEITSWKIIKN